MDLPSFSAMGEGLQYGWNPLEKASRKDFFFRELLECRNMTMTRSEVKSPETLSRVSIYLPLHGVKM